MELELEGEEGLEEGTEEAPSLESRLSSIEGKMDKILSLGIWPEDINDLPNTAKPAPKKPDLSAKYSELLNKKA